MSKEKFLTPIAPCKWAHTVVPNIDQNGQYKDAFEITLTLDAKDKDHKALLGQIKALHVKSGNPAKTDEDKHPIKHDTEKQEDDSFIKTGLYAVKFKTTFTKKKITTIDSKMKPIDVESKDENFIGNGSIVKVGWTYDFYKQGKGGLSLYLNFVQIIDLVEYAGGVDPSEYGAVEEEGGYVETTPTESMVEEFEKQKADDLDNVFDGDPQPDKTDNGEPTEAAELNEVEDDLPF